MTGFGADGSRLEKELDFEQVRGDFENNPFVTAVLKHIDVKTALGDGDRTHAKVQWRWGGGMANPFVLYD